MSERRPVDLCRRRGCQGVYLESAEPVKHPRREVRPDGLARTVWDAESDPVLYCTGCGAERRPEGD